MFLISLQYVIILTFFWVIQKQSQVSNYISFIKTLQPS